MGTQASSSSNIPLVMLGRQGSAPRRDLRRILNLPKGGRSRTRREFKNQKQKRETGPLVRRKKEESGGKKEKGETWTVNISVAPLSRTKAKRPEVTRFTDPSRQQRGGRF